jgi:hypothetical protein
VLLQSLTTVVKSLGVDSTGLPPDWADKLSQTVKTMSDSIVTLVEKMVPSFVKLLGAVGQMHFSESDAKALAVVGPMVSGMLAFSVSVMTMSGGEIVKQFLKQSTQVDADALSKKLQAAVQIVPTIIDGVVSSIPRILVTMKKLIVGFSNSDMSPDILKKGLDTIASVVETINIIPKLMAGIESMRGMTDKLISPEVLKANMEAGIDVPLSTKVAESNQEMTDRITATLSVFARMLLGLVGDKGEGSLMNLLRIISGAGTRAMLIVGDGKAIKAGTDAITSIVTVVSALGSVMGSWDTIAKSMTTTTKTDKGDVTNAPSDSNIAGKIKEVFTQLSWVIAGIMGADAGKAVRDILINLSNLGGLITNTKGMSGQIKAAGDFIVTISEVAKNLKVIQELDIPRSEIDAKLATNLNSLYFGILKISGAGGFVDLFNKAVGSAALGSIAAAAVNMQTYSKSLENMKIQMENVKNSLSAISPLLENINAITNTINEMKTMKLDAKLAPIAGGAMGGKFVYNIAAEPVTIKVELNVQMSSREVEAQIVGSKSSVIKAKLNEIITTVQKHTTAASTALTPLPE